MMSWLLQFCYPSVEVIVAIWSVTGGGSPWNMKFIGLMHSEIQVGIPRHFPRVFTVSDKTFWGSSEIFGGLWHLLKCDSCLSGEPLTSSQLCPIKRDENPQACEWMSQYLPWGEFYNQDCSQRRRLHNKNTTSPHRISCLLVPSLT